MALRLTRYHVAHSRARVALPASALRIIDARRVREMWTRVLSISYPLDVQHIMSHTQ